MDNESMHVVIERTGGITGISITKAMDADDMTLDEAKRLRQMVETADFFRLPSVIPNKPQPDRFQYRITIDHSGRKHSVTVSESAIPPTLKPLLNWLMAMGTDAPKALR